MATSDEPAVKMVRDQPYAKVHQQTFGRLGHGDSSRSSCMRCHADIDFRGCGRQERQAQARSSFIRQSLISQSYKVFVSCE
jgi:hypothetical protein